MTALHRRHLLAGAAATATGPRPGAALAEPAGPHHRPPGAGRHDRHHRADHRRAAHAAARPAGGGGEPARREWLDRQRLRHAGTARRPHADRQQRLDRGGELGVGRRPPLVPSRNLAPVTNLIEAPQVFVAPADFPAADLAEFVARARAASPSLVFASAGVGSYQHIDMEALAKRAGITMVHLPLRGAGEVVPSMLRGDAQITELALNSTLPQIQAGRCGAGHRRRDADAAGAPHAHRRRGRLSRAGHDAVERPVRARPARRRRSSPRCIVM
jgi:hypothetical protein